MATERAGHRNRLALAFALSAAASNLACPTLALSQTTISSDAAHLRFAREWWRFSIRAHSDDGRDVGIVATYFRSRIDARSGDAYSAVLALTDLSSGARSESERAGRAALGDARAATSSFAVDVASWSARERADRSGAKRFELRMMTPQDGIALILATPHRAEIEDARGFFQDGNVRNASHYFAYTACRASGTIAMAHRTFRVNGTGWIDHIFGDERISLHPAWSVFEVQLSDGRQVMIDENRDRDGGVLEKVIVVDADRNAHVLAPVTTSWREGVGPYFWRSTQTRAVYPDLEHVVLETFGIDVLATPAVPAQEFVSKAGTAYWDGALNVSDFASAKKESGIGFAQLTGY